VTHGRARTSQTGFLYWREFRPGPAGARRSLAAGGTMAVKKGQDRPYVQETAHP